MTKKQKIVYYVLLVLITLQFIAAGIPKLMALDMEVSGFALIGLPVWFMYVIGVGEILGAIGLWFRLTFRYAYEGLFLVLAGAVVTTAIYVSVVMALLPLVAAIILGIVVCLDKKRGTPVVVA